MTRTDGWTEIANPWAPDGAKSSLHEFVEVAYKVYFPACANLCLGYDRCCEEGGEEQGRGWSHGHRSTYNVCPCCWRSGIDLNNILMLLQVTDTQGSEPRLSPRLSPLMRCYTTTATAVYTCTQHVHTQQQHTCTVYIMWCSVSSHVLTICKHKSWSQLLSSVHVFFNKFNFVMDVHASMFKKVRIQSHFCVFIVWMFLLLFLLCDWLQEVIVGIFVFWASCDPVSCSCCYYAGVRVLTMCPESLSYYHQNEQHISRGVSHTIHYTSSLCHSFCLLCWSISIFPEGATKQCTYVSI